MTENEEDGHVFRNLYQPPTSDPLSENVPAQSIDATRRYWWYVAIAYSLPIAIAFPMCFEAIWYGTGMIGTAGRVFQVVLYVTGTYFAWRALISGTTPQRLAVLPAVLAYTGLVLGILMDQ